MRAYEYYQAYGIKHFNNLLEAERRSIGLLCSFQSHVPLGDSGLYYDVHEIIKECKSLCDSLQVDFHVVGLNQNSLDWLDEVYKVILGSDLVLVDVSDPRPNVLYELGVACSFRPYDAVIITKHTSSSFACSEVEQLQILLYDCLHDLRAKIVQHFKAHPWPLESELDEFFPKLHNKLDPDLMIFLFRIRENHLTRNPDGTGAWHYSFKEEKDFRTASALIELGLAKYEYGVAKEKNKLEWALYPTELCKRYMESEHFKKFFYPTDP